MDNWVRLEKCLVGLGDEGRRLAMAAAFALVCAADGEIAAPEAKRARELLLSRPASPYRDVVGATSVSAERAAEVDLALQGVFADLLDDFDGARSRALAVLARAAGFGEEAEAIVAAAQAAIVADGVISEREEVALGDVCAALGVDPHGR